MAVKIIMATTAAGTICSVNHGLVARTRRSRATTRRAANDGQDAHAAVEQEVDSIRRDGGVGASCRSSGRSRSPATAKNAAESHVEAHRGEVQRRKTVEPGRGGGGRRIVVPCFSLCPRQRYCAGGCISTVSGTHVGPADGGVTCGRSASRRIFGMPNFLFRCAKVVRRTSPAGCVPHCRGQPPSPPLIPCPRTPAAVRGWLARRGHGGATSPWC